MKSMAIVAAAAWTASVSAQNLVVNGGFEQSIYPRDCCIVCGTAVQIPGWVASNVDHLVLNASAGAIPVEGLRFVDLNQCSPGFIRQIIPTQIGQRYRLSFLIGSAFAGCNPGLHEAQVTFGPMVESIQFFEASGVSRVNFVIAATSEQTTLEFRGISGGCESAILDDVVVRPMMCVGDTDLSGAVDGVDLAIVLQNWGLSSPEYSGADIDGNGTVDGSDLALLLSAWGDCP